jgi:UTP--glucose-1-phosphate uridylyltransferase
MDIFSEIADKPELVALTQRVLNSYADQDWHGIASVLPMELFQSSTIVDLGGGIGALLRELSKQCAKQRLICIDRPEVIRLASSHPNIEFLSGDLFSSSLPSADFYLLSRVLHDWPDDQVKIVLNRIPAKYLCIIDREVDININQHAFLSLHMFLMHRAKERTRQEWDYLFSTTAWSVQSRILFSDHIVTFLKKESNNTHTSMSLSTSGKACVRKVVLPIAGLGTRMRPQSTILPKILLPIVQSDSTTWKCRPVVDLLLEEIFTKETEIEQVLFVIAPEQLHLFQSYLSSYPHQNIEFILQQSPKGFLQTEQYVDNEPFVVMLSDHLYQSNNSNQSCLQQLLNAYRQNVTNSSVIGLTGVMTCTSEEVLETGLLQSDINMKDKQFFEITDMIEKPSIEVALNRFQFRTFDRRFLCQAGIDILPPTIFDQLRQHEQRLEQEKNTSELGLREAMNCLRQNGQLRGCLLDGYRYDIGNPKEYYRTFRAFAIEKKQKPQRNVSISDAWPLVQQIDQVRTLFSASKTPIYSASAPGRLDIMGGLLKRIEFYTTI